MAKLTTGVARKAMSRATFSEAPGFLALRDGTVNSHTNQNPSTWMDRSTCGKKGTWSYACPMLMLMLDIPHNRRE